MKFQNLGGIMETYYTQPIVEMGVALTELAVKGTATAVANKVKAVKNEKNTEKVRNTYDEIINELLSERDEAVRLAQAYKSELDRIVISDEDIQHLNATATRVLDILKKFSPELDTDSLQALKDLISVDTLKTMQLLGFNYKAAIGEPLTQLCANAIGGIGNNTKKNPNKKR